MALLNTRELINWFSWSSQSSLSKQNKREKIRVHGSNNQELQQKNFSEQASIFVKNLYKQVKE
jgi:hypothetical protein